ncbi:unnamed protein product, partial [Ectocarpus sp. 12 AP-2014]
KLSPRHTAPKCPRRFPTGLWSLSPEGFVDSDTSLDFPAYTFISGYYQLADFSALDLIKCISRSTREPLHKIDSQLPILHRNNNVTRSWANQFILVLTSDTS